ncbi:MAG: hypothetical protein WBM44_01325 [Waterburya sp.]
MAVSVRGDKSICLPVGSEEQYQQLIADHHNFRAYLLQVYGKYPEIFPRGMESGFSFHDWVVSRKQELSMRRIKLKTTQEVYQLRPDFMMPYMVAKTEEIDKPMYLRQFGVPFDAIAYVFGRNAMYWYRIYLSLGRASIGGTTIKDPQKLPQHLVADEKHTWLEGNRVDLPTTVAKGCFLGVSFTLIC